jgi:hypothetical protein
MDYCFDRYINNESYLPNSYFKNANPALARAALLKKSLWNRDQVITVKFLNGEPWQRAWVQKVVQDNLIDTITQEMNFVNDEQEANIRIEFKSSFGSYSYIGTDNLYIYDQKEPTMVLERLDAPGSLNTTGSFVWKNVVYNVPSGQKRNGNTVGGTIIHEFCHVMGMVHEHQNPVNNPIEWNEPYIIEVSSQEPNFWDEEKTNQNIINKYDEDQLNASSYDSNSVMLYYFPTQFTLNGISTQLNPTLSEDDKLWLRNAYFTASNPTSTATTTTSTQNIINNFVLFIKRLIDNVILFLKKLVDQLNLNTLLPKF